MADYKKGDGGYRLPAITDPERICIQLEVPNEPDHLRAFWGALWTLSWYSSWEKDDNKRGRDVAAVWKDVWFKARAANQEWDACLDCENEGCVEYSPQYIQEWFPNNPYISIPPGTEKKWYIAPEVNLLGVPAGTVVTDIVNTQPGPGDPDLPRVRFYFSGTGVIEIHFHSVILGGAAQIQVDGELLSLRYENLLADIFRAPPDTPAPVIHEVEITIPGNHFIDITMVPILNDETTFVGFGGGLTKLVFCGFDNMYVEPQFRFTEACGLEQSNDGGATWNPVPGWDTWAADCFTGPTGPAGPAGEQGPTGEPPDPFEDEDGVPDPVGAPGEAKRCEIAARVVNSLIDRRYAPFLTDAAIAFQQEGLTAAQLGNELENWTLAGASGAFFIDGLNGTLPWNSWTGVVSSLFTIGVGSGGITARVIALWEAQQALDVLAIRNEVQGDEAREALICALYNNLNEDGSIDAATYSLWKSSIAGLTEGISATARDDFGRFLDQLIPLSVVRLSARDSQASTDFDCAVCEIDFEWSATFDFRTSDWGWTGNRGVWTAGVGWVSQFQSTGDRFEIIGLNIQFTLNQSNMHSAIVTRTRTVRDEEGAFLSTRSGDPDDVPLPLGSFGETSHLVTGLSFGTQIRLSDTVADEQNFQDDFGPDAAEVICHQIRIFGNGTRPVELAGVPD